MLYLTGDINLTDGYFDTGFGVGSRIAAGADPFAAIPRDANDLWIGNFEGVTARTSPKPGIYGKQFIIPPEAIAHLRHFDYYNVANNHSMQHGAPAFEEMLGHLKSFGSSYFGENEQRSVTFTHQGKKFSISGFSQRKENFSTPPHYWYNPEYKAIEAELAKYADCDFRIAYVHWGIEFMDRPYNDQIRFARMLVDAGFDLIVGLHPHRLQGYECYKGKYIYYSIGNFVFNMHWEPLRYGAVLSVGLSDDGFTVNHHYVRIGNDYFPRFIEKDEVPPPYRFSTLNRLLSTDLSQEEYYAILRKKSRKYRWDNRITLLRNLSKFRVSYAGLILTDYLKRLL